MPRPLIIAHRGASHDAEENTVAAFRLAWDQGADAIETDLRLTADGEIVAHHGAMLARGGPALREFARPEINPIIPSLAEVLALVPPDKHLVLELKEPIVAELTRALVAAPLERITLIAFDPLVISAAKRALPDCQALWLFGDYSSLRRDPGAWLAAQVRTLGVDGVDLRYERRLDAGLLAPLREEGRTIFTYTVNSSRPAVRAARLEINGLTTDRPADARRWLGIST